MFFFTIFLWKRQMYLSERTEISEYRPEKSSAVKYSFL